MRECLGCGERFLPWCGQRYCSPHCRMRNRREREPSESPEHAARAERIAAARARTRERVDAILVKSRPGPPACMATPAPAFDARVRVPYGQPLEGACPITRPESGW